MRISSVLLGSIDELDDLGNIGSNEKTKITPLETAIAFVGMGIFGWWMFWGKSWYNKRKAEKK